MSKPRRSGRENIGPVGNRRFDTSRLFVADAACVGHGSFDRFAPFINALFVQLFDLLFVLIGEFRLSGNILAAAAGEDCGNNHSA
jgi:hypothetical protein